jgi:hypothetical protein
MFEIFVKLLAATVKLEVFFLCLCAVLWTLHVDASRAWEIVQVGVGVNAFVFLLCLVTYKKED